MINKSSLLYSDREFHSEPYLTQNSLYQQVNQISALFNSSSNMYRTMSERLAKNISEEKNDFASFESIATSWVSSALIHPLYYTHTLVQLGHEPLPLYQARTWTYFQKANYLPGVFRYSAYIVAQDGIFGLFRGLTPRFGSDLSYTLARRFFDKQLTKHAQICPESASIEDTWKDGLKKTAQKITHTVVVR